MRFCCGFFIYKIANFVDLSTEFFGNGKFCQIVMKLFTFKGELGQSKL